MSDLLARILEDDSLIGDPDSSGAGSGGSTGGGTTGGGTTGGTPSNLSINRYNFTEGDLSIAGFFVKAHGLGRSPLAARIVDQFGERVEPDREIDANLNTISVDMSTFRPITGVWALLVV